MQYDFQREFHTNQDSVPVAQPLRVNSVVVSSRHKSKLPDVGVNMSYFHGTLASELIDT